MGGACGMTTADDRVVVGHMVITNTVPRLKANVWSQARDTRIPPLLCRVCVHASTFWVGRLQIVVTGPRHSGLRPYRCPCTCLHDDDSGHGGRDRCAVNADLDNCQSREQDQRCTFPNRRGRLKLNRKRLCNYQKERMNMRHSRVLRN